MIRFNIFISKRNDGKYLPAVYDIEESPRSTKTEYGQPIFIPLANPELNQVVSECEDWIKKNYPNQEYKIHSEIDVFTRPGEKRNVGRYEEDYDE